jgi:hypothetical protein
MAGRGDNNKKHTSGRGSSNQSNQPFVNTAANESASNHAKRVTGGHPSIPQDRTRSIDADRNAGRAIEKIKPMRAEEKTFDLLVDNVPYLVKVSPFTFNDETRFYISVNGGEEHVFTWDSELKGLRAIDDSASSLPSRLEEEISGRLQSVQG